MWRWVERGAYRRVEKKVKVGAMNVFLRVVLFRVNDCSIIWMTFIK